MLVISAEEQQRVMNMKDVIDACATAVQEYSAGRTETPIRSTLPVKEHQGKSLTMPSVAEEAKAMGLKHVTSFPNNTKVGKKNIHGVVFLSDVETGEPLAVLEGSYLTIVKTGAISGLATKWLAREDASSLCIIGTGAQAPGLIEAVLAVRQIEDIFLVNRSRTKAEDLAETLRKQFGGENLTVTVLDDANEAVTKSDIIVTSTSSTTPIFSADKVKPGSHINAVGSFHPTMQEIPSQTVATADRIFVESVNASLEETGDLQVPIEEGVFKDSDLDGELGELIEGKIEGRTHDQEITLFKSVGLAVADIVVADLIYQKVHQAGGGQKVDL